MLGIISELQTSKIVFIGTKKSYLLLFHSNRLKKKIEVRKKKKKDPFSLNWFRQILVIKFRISQPRNDRK